MRKLLFTVFVAGLYLVIALPATPSPQANTLEGTWDTGPVPVAKIVAALRAHGYTPSETETFIHNQQKAKSFDKSFEQRLVFYRQNGVPFLLKSTWGDHGPYKLLPNGRFVWSGVDPPTDTYHTTYSYAVTGSRLVMRFISLVEPGVSEKQRLADQKVSIVVAAAPYRKVHG